MKSIVYVVAAVALLGGLFLVFRPETGKEAGPPVSAVSSALSSAPAPTPPVPAPAALPGATLPESKDAGPEVELVLARGRLVSGPSVVRVRQNDPLASGAVVRTSRR